MMIDDRDKKAAVATQVATAQAPQLKKPANAGALPPGSIESAFNEARRELALVGGEEG
jgi:hypothetical protein